MPSDTNGYELCLQIRNWTDAVWMSNPAGRDLLLNVQPVGCPWEARSARKSTKLTLLGPLDNVK